MNREELKKLFKKELYRRPDRYRILFLHNLGICQICKKPVDPTISKRSHHFIGTIDHIIPLSKGGKDHISNLQLAHQRCNVDKGNFLKGDVKFDLSTPNGRTKARAYRRKRRRNRSNKEILSPITY